uniref:Uncharacterized protein n=1 Tax=Anguilla anguilla TaxID=7936 RepID=A0A0E9PSS6_ANGAN
MSGWTNLIHFITVYICLGVTKSRRKRGLLWI